MWHLRSFVYHVHDCPCRADRRRQGWELGGPQVQKMEFRKLSGRALPPKQPAAEVPGAVFAEGLEATDPDMFSQSGQKLLATGAVRQGKPVVAWIIC